MPDPAPGIDRLLIDSALQDSLRRRLRENPDEVFAEYNLTGEQIEILRQPGARLLELLGAAISRQSESAESHAAGPAGGPTPSTGPAFTLPGFSLVLTVAPYLQRSNALGDTYSYAAWVHTLPEGSDPGLIPPPPGAMLAGYPLAPLNAVIQISAMQLQDSVGYPQIGLWATLRQASNVSAAPLEATSPSPDDWIYRTDRVKAAVAGVRAAAPEERYGKLIHLLNVLREAHEAGPL